MSTLKSVGALDARRTLRKQQRTATLVSLIVALLLMLLMGLILAIILFAVGSEEKPQIVAYAGQVDAEQRVTKPKVKTEVARKPAAPSQAMSRVVVANTQSPTSIPVPEINIEETSLDIGVGDDFGSGWDSGEGFGSGGGSTFFGQTSSAERVAYVIDFSASMRGQNRHRLMRTELSESISLMHPGLQLGMIFFSGPAWVAGDTVDKKGTVNGQDGKTYKFKRPGSHGSWLHDGVKQKVPWLTVTEDEVVRLTKVVNKTPLSGGTVWNIPLNMALDMDPAPQLIYFMTDGVAGGADAWAKEIGSRAKKMGVVINCVSLMEPKALKGLKTIADMSGGAVTMVDANGKRQEIK